MATGSGSAMSMRLVEMSQSCSQKRSSGHAVLATEWYCNSCVENVDNTTMKYHKIPTLCQFCNLLVCRTCDLSECHFCGEMFCDDCRFDEFEHRGRLAYTT